MDDERVIAAVQCRPPLYDKNHPKHCNRELIRTLWEECATEIGGNIDQVKRRWAYLRDYFTKLYRLSKIPSSRRKKWPLFDSMMFIVGDGRDLTEDSGLEETYPMHSQNFSFLSHGNQKPSNIMNIENCDSEAVKEEIDGHENSLLEATPTINVKRGRLDFDAYLERGKQDSAYHSTEPFVYMNEKEYTKSFKPEDEDDDLCFFKSLMPMLKKLDDIEKIEFRMAVQNTLLECMKKRRDREQSNSSDFSEEKVFQ
ncbi:uncharacterized protein LOC108666328 [Hyalella azteca]|uniref:Uncharacterized protein LOC108666328 n=1 Tax=Hyalella azteca TaxID=294128 RepID=A0A8B7N478_HYAAZ|nr:uncharacterized protein LOC108666328 [Hyalella azteca]